MTRAERIVAVLRESGAAHVWLDDSALDDGCRVDSSDGWYLSVAESVLDALAEPRVPRGPHCPRCGADRPHGTLPLQVCAPCAAEMGWDPPCAACKLEDAGQAVGDAVHVTTCGGET